MKFFSTISRKLILIFISVMIVTIILAIVISNSILSPRLEQQVIDRASYANQQISDRTDILLKEIRYYTTSLVAGNDLIGALQYFYSHPQSNDAQSKISLTLSSIVARYPLLFKSILIVDEAGNNFSSFSYTTGDLANVSPDWYNTVINSEQISTFSNIYTVSQFRSSYFGVYAQKFDLDERKYSIFTFFYADSIIDEANDLAENTFDNFVLTNKNYESFYTYDPDSLMNIPSIELNPLNDATILDGTDGKYLIKRMYSSPWYIIAFLSYSSLNDAYIFYITTLILMFVFTGTLSVILATIAVTLTMQPLKSLASVMFRVGKGDYSVRAKVSTRDEIGNLAGIFNQMLVDLQAQIQSLLEKEKNEQRMKYAMLIAQIDPHFICNTMSKINILARKKRFDEVISINTALINILRDRLRIDSAFVFDSVDQEIATLKQYLLILSYRCENKVNIYWDISETVKNQLIPKNILQPLVENAFFHGMTDQNDGTISGDIKISVKYIDDNIVITVFNTGQAIEKTKLSELNSPEPKHQRRRGLHIGLLNIRNRLKYLYGDKACFVLESTPGIGTLVTITLDPSAPGESWYEPQHFD